MNIQKFLLFFFLAGGGLLFHLEDQSHLSRQKKKKSINKHTPASTEKFTDVVFFPPESASDSNEPCNVALFEPLQSRYNIDLNRDALFVVSSNEGDCVLIDESELGFSPLLSFNGVDHHVWQTSTMIEFRNQQSNMRSTNLSYRTNPGEDISSPNTVPYLLFGQERDRFHLIPLTQLVTTPRGSFYKWKNKFYQPNGDMIFQYETLSQNSWKLRGSYRSSMFCDGSVFIEKNNQVVSLTREFGSISAALWKKSGATIRFSKFIDANLFSKYHQDIDACQHNSLESVIHLANENEFKTTFTPLIKRAVPFEFGKIYNTGQKVIVADETYTVLEANTYINHYHLLGENTAVYSVTSDRRKKFKIEFFSTSKNYVKYALARVQFLNSARIEQQAIAREFANDARQRLKIAEVKANSVGAGFKEWYKPVVSIATFAASDAMLNSNLSKALGIKSSGTGIQGAITAVDATVKTKILAATIFSLTQGVSISSFVAAAQFESKTAAEHLKNSGRTLGQVSVANGLRTVGAILPGGQATYLFTFASGMAFQYRRVSTNAELGYEGKRDLLNVLSGGATSLAQVVAIDKGMGAGKIKAIGGAGVLLSEVIAGRGYPGVVAGTLVEIGTNLAVGHPVIRPFASTLASQVSALMQLGDAYQAGKKAGRELDKASGYSNEQKHKLNALSHLLSNNPRFVKSLDHQTLHMAVSTFLDPYRELRIHFQK